MSGSASVMTGGVAPAVVVLADAPSIAVDASLGSDFRVTIAGNRTMGKPASPTDGQKIIFQITQGDGGPFTITWDSGYEFPAGLPPPALSTGQGQTDLAGFIYDAAKGTWLFAAAVTGFSPAAPPAASTYRLFPTTSGPATPVSYSGPFQAGVLFQVTTGGMWLDGYWWWVCPAGQATGPQQFALWQVSSAGGGTLIGDATVLSGRLTAGQWNYVPLAVPVPLAAGACYNACTGFHGSFPGTGGQFRSGITNGPLTAFSDQSGSQPAPTGTAQGLFGISGANPTVSMPVNGSSASNFWMDIQASAAAPGRASRRLWPSYPVIPGMISNDTSEQTFGTQFRLTQPATLDYLWFYSPPGVSILPSRCAVWDADTRTVIAGTDAHSPAWSGAAGSGWVSCAYGGITLAPGNYLASVYSAGGVRFYQENVRYFSSGPGRDGIMSGPLSSPSVARSPAPGNSAYQVGPFAFPGTFDHNDDGETRWVDVEVTPVPGDPAAFLIFFP